MISISLSLYLKLKVGGSFRIHVFIFHRKSQSISLYHYYSLWRRYNECYVYIIYIKLIIFGYILQRELAMQL